jgi:LPS-assembly lipoprotein
MSSSDRISRRGALGLFAIVPMLALGGCFTPLYAPDAGGGLSVRDKLSTVAVDTVEGRVGVEFRNQILFGLTGGAAPAAPAYTLAVVLTSTRESSIINAETSKPEIDTVRLEGVYTLTEIATGTVITSGKEFAVTSFDRGLQRFAAVRAARDAENRLAETLADQIKNQIAIRFSRQG